jgi:hypothetical protein
MEVTDNSIGDAPVLPELLDQIPPAEQIASVSADGAYDTKACHEAIALRQTHAVIPTQRNAKPWKTNRPGTEARNEILHATRRLGRTIGRGGVAITDEVSSKRKCAASSSLASAFKHVTSIVKSLNCRYMLLC